MGFAYFLQRWEKWDMYGYTREFFSDFKLHSSFGDRLRKTHVNKEGISNTCPRGSQR
jgi:hypothetical protein